MSRERVSGFPEQGAADLRGSPGNFRGNPGNFRGNPGTSGEVWETSRESLDCC